MIEVKTWEDIKSFDDIVLPREKEIISELEKKFIVKCPYLQKEGKFFYYCDLNLPETNDKKPTPTNPIYQKHINLIELQLYCMGDFGRCCIYFSTSKRQM